MQQDKNEAPREQGLDTLSCWAKSAAVAVGWALLFGVCYTQAPLYYSNQNQYFLHGLAQGGLGFLEQDWLANTRDPTPVFSALVAFTYRYLHVELFYVYYLVILGIYCLSLAGLQSLITGIRATGLGRLCFLTFFVAIHSGLVRLASARLFGVDYPWYLQAGVANQYLLGPVLQPSVFGVFLLAGVVAFLRDRLVVAALCTSLAATFHSTYLLPAAMLTLAYMYVLFREERLREAMLLGICSLILVLPVVIYNLRTFAPSSAEGFAETQRLLAEFRIPVHALPRKWCDIVAVCQLGWIVWAMYLVRGQRLFCILLVPFLLSMALTLLQVGTDNATLALLFPWRVSTVLVALATTIILARLVQGLASWLDPRSPWKSQMIRLACLATLGGLLTGGVAINYFELAYVMNQEEIPVMEYVRTQKQSGEIYLLPIEVPDLASGPRGAASLSFTPPPRHGKDGHLIAVDFLRFRLWTGAPIYVDFKSIPYQDAEVLEWLERLLWNQKRYQDWDRDPKEIQTELASRGITHIVTTTERDISWAGLDTVYHDANYRVYHVGRPPRAR